MQKVENKHRFFRLMNEAIERMGLNLRGLTVLTEAASDSYICTSLLAASAGAKVIAVTKSSHFGSSKDIILYGADMAKDFGVESSIKFTDSSPLNFAAKADLVTNLGFVRPINADFVALLKRTAVISLMWEPWEIREGEIDFSACKDRLIPVIGTNEHHDFLQTFEYVGVTALKLLLEANIEVFRSKIGIIGSDPFGSAIALRLQMCGGIVQKIALPINAEITNENLSSMDAIVVAEHRSGLEAIGENGGISAQFLQKHNIALIHICGNVDTNNTNQWNLKKHPPQIVNQGYMTVTTSYVGPRPVIDLHCAGLRLGADALRCRIRGATMKETIANAEASGLGLRIPGWITY